MNAIKLLTSDHEVVETLFKKAESGDGDNVSLFKDVKTNLELHAHIEETIFYPAIQEDGSEDLVELVSDALKEHAQAKAFLGELDVLADAGDAKFNSLFTKLIEDVRHHVRDEEDDMFPKVRDEFSSDTLTSWGGQMSAEKDNFAKSADSAYN